MASRTGRVGVMGGGWEGRAEEEEGEGGKRYRGFKPLSLVFSLTWTSAESVILFRINIVNSFPFLGGRAYVVEKTHCVYYSYYKCCYTNSSKLSKVHCIYFVLNRRRQILHTDLETFPFHDNHE